MVNMENYRKLVQVLNSHDLRYKDSATISELKIMSLTVMPPSLAEQTVNDLVKEGLLTRKGDLIIYSNLYDPKQERYVPKSKATGKTLRSTRRKAELMKRTVKYKSPGVTIVNYPHRTLEIRFTETDSEYDKRKKARRSKAAKNRKYNDTILVDRDESGNLHYTSRTGTDITHRTRARAEKGQKEITMNDLKNDKHLVEELRAILKDDHWEEVCNHTRWKRDPKSTVQEYNRYLRYSRRK